MRRRSGSVGGRRRLSEVMRSTRERALRRSSAPSPGREGVRGGLGGVRAARVGHVRSMFLATFERQPNPKQEVGALARPYAPKSRRTPRVSTPVPSSSAAARRMRATIGCAGRRGGAALSASYGAAGAVARRRTLSTLVIWGFFFVSRSAHPPQQRAHQRTSATKKNKHPRRWTEVAQAVSRRCASARETELRSELRHALPTASRFGSVSSLAAMGVCGGGAPSNLANGGGCPLEGPRAPTQTRRVVVDVCSSLKKGGERSVTRIPPLPFLQSALVALERAPPRRGARQGPLSGQGGARAQCSHLTPLDPRTAHAIQRPAAVGGGRAHTHRTVRHSWRRTGHHGGGAGPRRPRRAAARETALVGEAASGGTPPCGRGHSHHTMCRTQRRRGRLAGGRFRAPRRAEPRAKAGEGRPAPPHAQRAHRAPCVRPQRPVDPTFTRRVKVGCS